MASGVPLTPRTLANSQQNDLQRIANPRLEINERRLRPIYDFMEIHNYRRALTEIDRLLKKQANFTACKALKCLVLLKLERSDEARALANELDALALVATRPMPGTDAPYMDENALTFFSQYYKDLRQYEKVVNLYEAASKREPTSEEYLCSLFMAHVRVKDYKNQMLTAQKLYKLTRKTPYYDWAVISVLLQINENSEQLKQTLYIPMALKMLEKEFFDDQHQTMKNYGEMECLLYLHALELKEDFPKASNFLQKHLEMLTKAPSNESMLPAYFSHEKQLMYHFKANQLSNTYRLAKDFLREDNFLWNWFEVLFDAFFLFDANDQEKLVEDLHEFILKTPDDSADLRSLHLARIELGLRWRLFQLRNPSSTLPSIASTYLSERFVKEILFYIDQYSGKTSGLVIFDIYRALEYLSTDDQSRLHAELVDRMSTKNNEENLQDLINFFYVARSCGEVHRQWLEKNHSVWIERFLQIAFQSTNLSIELILLVSNILEQIDRSKSDLYVLLDRAHERDPTHFDVKLYLYQLAIHFNCLTIAKDIFERLEIKNIQYYSLGYLLTDHYLRIHTNYRHLKFFFHYLTNLLLVYTDDSWSQIMFCYKYGNFLRINEIRTFSDSFLSYSLIYMESSIGLLVIDLIQNGNRCSSIGNLFKQSSSQILFEQKKATNPSLHSFFYKTDQYDSLKLQDTRDFDIWPKVDLRRLRPDGNQNSSVEVTTYADRILGESAGRSTYQSPSYKDSFLRQYQTQDFQQRSSLCYLRLTILNLLHTLFNDSSSTTAVHMPDEHLLQALTTINKDLENCTRALKPTETISPCEMQSIIDLELFQSIPMFIEILLSGLTIKKTSEASATPSVLSLSSATIHFDRIDQQFNGIIKQLERSFQLLRQFIEKTSFQKHCQDNAETTTDEHSSFLDDFAGLQSPLELYSVYTEFISYAYSFYLAIRSILANLFNRTAYLVDNSDTANARAATTKKSKKKAAEQQVSTGSTANENEDENKLFAHVDNVERLFDDQWTQIIGNIRKYEVYLRQQGKLNNDECDRLEKDIDITADTQSASKNKAKPDENNNNNNSSRTETSETKDSQTTSGFQLGQTAMRPSTLRSFALGYLESLIQLRVALATKQKTLRLHQTNA